MSLNLRSIIDPELSIFSNYQTEYWYSSSPKARKNPKMVRNITAFAVKTRPHAPPLIIPSTGGLGSVEFAMLVGDTGARCNTIGSAKADITIPVVRNHASSLC